MPKATNRFILEKIRGSEKRLISCCQAPLMAVVKRLKNSFKKPISEISKIRMKESNKNVFGTKVSRFAGCLLPNGLHRLPNDTKMH